MRNFGFNPSTGLMLISTRAVYAPQPTTHSFNPSTGLMLISTSIVLGLRSHHRRFNPSTGLMLISTHRHAVGVGGNRQFQSLDWVDVDFDVAGVRQAVERSKFQSLDWVDVDFDSSCLSALSKPKVVSIPRLG